MLSLKRVPRWAKIRKYCKSILVKNKKGWRGTVLGLIRAVIRACFGPRLQELIR